MMETPTKGDICLRWRRSQTWGDPKPAGKNESEQGRLRGTNRRSHRLRCSRIHLFVSANEPGLGPCVTLQLCASRQDAEKKNKRKLAAVTRTGRKGKVAYHLNLGPVMFGPAEGDGAGDTYTTPCSISRRMIPPAAMTNVSDCQPTRPPTHCPRAQAGNGPFGAHKPLHIWANGADQAVNTTITLGKGRH